METQQHIAILGSGNIGLALAKGLVKAGIFALQQITLRAATWPPLLLWHNMVTM
jgi:pyrroline-5-carboxylate reductase